MGKGTEKKSRRLSREYKARCRKQSTRSGKERGSEWHSRRA